MIFLGYCGASAFMFWTMRKEDELLRLLLFILFIMGGALLALVTK
jgi:hypothetical protein